MKITESIPFPSEVVPIHHNLKVLVTPVDFSEEGYSARKLAGSVIIAILGGLALAQTAIIDGLTEPAIVLVGLTTGFAADFAITRAKKD